MHAFSPQFDTTMVSYKPPSINLEIIAYHFGLEQMENICFCRGAENFFAATELLAATCGYRTNSEHILF